MQIKYVISKILSKESLDLSFDILSCKWAQKIIKIIELHTHTPLTSK